MYFIYPVRGGVTINVHKYPVHENLGYSAPAIFRDLRASRPLPAILGANILFNCGHSPRRGERVRKLSALAKSVIFARAVNYLYDTIRRYNFQVFLREYTQPQ